MNDIWKNVIGLLSDSCQCLRGLVFIIDPSNVKGSKGILLPTFKIREERQEFVGEGHSVKGHGNHPELNVLATLGA